jgi:hypothetical protein
MGEDERLSAVIDELGLLLDELRTRICRVSACRSRRTATSATS